MVSKVLSGGLKEAIGKLLCIDNIYVYYIPNKTCLFVKALMVVKKERVRVWGNEKCGLWTGTKKNMTSIQRALQLQ